MMKYDVDAIRQAGFTVIQEDMIRYTDDEFAQDYINWGFNSPEKQRSEAQFAIEQMVLASGSTILDIGCGNGTASVYLSCLGLKVTGLDISPVFIEAAKGLEKSSGSPESVAWECADFLTFSCPPHDAAVLLDAGLPVATDRFVGKLSEVVRPGGLFFLRYKDGPATRTELSQPRWVCTEGSASFTLEQHCFDEQAGEARDEWITIDLSAKVFRVRTIEHKVVPFNDFTTLMSAQGFGVIGTWGDINGSPVTEVSRLYALFAKE